MAENTSDRPGKTLFRCERGFGCRPVWAASSADPHSLCELKERSPQPWFSRAEDGAKPCADGLSAVMGQILSSLSTPVSRLVPTLMCLGAELRCTQEDLLCHAEPSQGCHGAGEAPLYLQNHSLFPGEDRLCPKDPLCQHYEGGEQWQGRVSGWFGPGWPTGEFSETSGSVGLSLVAQPKEVSSAVGQCNSRLTKVSLAVDDGGLVILMPDTERLRGMRHNFLGLI